MQGNVGYELLNVPFPEMIFSMASAIARSQAALDRESINILRVMGDKVNAPVHLPTINVDGSGKLLDDSKEFTTSMIGAGFQPTFYQFVETIIEVKMDITVVNSGDEPMQKFMGYQTTTKSYFFGLCRKICVTPINARYTNSYTHTVEGHSLLRTRLVPLPPNTFIQRLLDMKAQAIQAAFEVELKKAELAIEILQAEENAKAALAEKNAPVPQLTPTSA